MNYQKVLLCLIVSLAFMSCKVDDAEDDVKLVQPAIITSNVTEASTSKATLNGEIVEIGNQKFSQFGFVWDTIPNLSINSPGKSIVSTIPIQGKISKTITNLKPGKTYHAKMFISNGKEIVFGEQVSFETKAQFIKSISSTIGYFGQELKIKGSGFSSRISDNHVKFTQKEFNYSSDAAVVSANDSVLTVLIPKYQYTTSTDPYKGKISLSVNQTQFEINEEFIFANTFFVDKTTAKAGDIVVFTIDNYASETNTYYFNEIPGKVRMSGSIPYGTQVQVIVPAGLTPGLVTLKVEAVSKRPVVPTSSNQLTITQ